MHSGILINMPFCIEILCIGLQLMLEGDGDGEVNSCDKTALYTTLICNPLDYFIVEVRVISHCMAVLQFWC